MAAKVRWIRLNVNWSEDGWLDNLPWEVRAVWPEWLCLVKDNGRNGVMPVTPLHRLAGSRNIPVDCVRSLLQAAIAEGAVQEIDGEWITVNWQRYQEVDSTNAERQARHRESQKRLAQSNESNGVMPVIVEPCNGDNTVTLSRVTTRPPDSNSPPATQTPQGEVAKPRKSGPVIPESIEVAIEYGKTIDLAEEDCRDWWDHFKSNGWKVSGRATMRDWEASMRRWKRENLKRAQAEQSKSPAKRDAPTAPVQNVDYVLRDLGDGVRPFDIEDPSKPFDAPEWFRQRGIKTMNRRWADYCDNFEQKKRAS